MPDNDVAVESKADCDAGFVVLVGEHCGQPARLSRIQQQEENVMVGHKFFDEVQILESLCDLGLSVRVVARHRHSNAESVGIDLWINLPELFGCSFGLGLSSVDGVFILVKSLPDWVGIAHFGVVNKSNVLDTPANKVARQLAAERSCAKEQALGCLDFGNVELGKQSPLHEPNVEVNCLSRQCLLVHEGLEIDLLRKLFVLGPVLEAVDPDLAGINGQQLRSVERVVSLVVVHQVLLYQQDAKVCQSLIANFIVGPEPGKESKHCLRMVSSCFFEVGGVHEAKEKLSALFLQKLSNARLLVAFQLLKDGKLRKDLILPRKLLQVV